MAGWLNDSPDRLTDVDIDGNEVTIAVVGPVEPPPVSELRPALQEVVGPDLDLHVRWTQESTPQADDEPEDEGVGPSTRSEPSPALTVDELEPLVEQWLAQSDASIDGFDVTGLDIEEDGTVAVTLESPVPPPPSDSLVSLIEDRFGTAAPVTVEWSDTSGEEQDRADEVADRIRRLVGEWAANQPGDLAVDRVELADGLLTVDLVGPTAPQDAVALVESIEAEVEDPPELEVRFTARPIIPTSTTTTTSTTTSEAPTSSAAPSTATTTGSTTPTTVAGG